MRTRTWVSPTLSSSCRRLLLRNGVTGWFSYDNQPPNGAFCPVSLRFDRWKEQTISDELSSPGSLAFHACTDVKNVAGQFYGDNNYTYSSYPYYVPLANISFLNSPVMYEPSYTFQDGIWGNLLDELASLADGRLKCAAMLPVSILEAAKTVAMIRNPFGLLKPTFRRRFRKKTLATLSKGPANVWLEGYYGWKSTYQDVCTIAKATVNFFKHPDTRAFEDAEGLRLSASHVDIEDKSEVYSLGTPASMWAGLTGPNWYRGLHRSGDYFFKLASEKKKTTYRLGCRQALDVAHRMGTLRRVFAHAGLNNWRDVRDTIWEVIPYSFVVDWFVNAKGMWAPINQMRLSQMDISKLGFSIKFTCNYVIDMFYNAGAALYDSSTEWRGKLPDEHPAGSIFRSSAGTYTSYTRRAGFPAITPASVVDATFLQHGLKRTQLLNGAALITQRLK